MKDRFYLTTPIYYVNDVPHIGHAYTTIAADVLARHYRKKLGPKNVYFLTGTDEHGAKIAEAAKKAGKKPKDFVDDLVPKFEKPWKALGISYDQFFRTTNPKHEKLVQDFIAKLDRAGYVEKRKYEGLYCVACEKYYPEDELEAGKCPIHGVKPVKQSEENYFFLLSKIADKLEAEIDSEKNIRVRPISRKNEVLSKIKSGLDDVSISREAVDWGVPYPGDSRQTVYVWVDALLNYYTASKIYPDAPKWPADLHLIGKDILWFHAVIWPGMLLAAGEALPKEVFAHGFFTIDGKKISKTIGNVIDPNALVEKFDADAVRYAILREIPFGDDGDISEEKIAQRYRADLANDLGNLLQRTLSMINKYKIPVKKERLTEVVDAALIENLQFEIYLTHIWRAVKDANAYIDNEKPWLLAKSDQKRLEKVLNEIYNQFFAIASAIEPIMPETAEKMEKQLETKKPVPLFPRLENAN